MIAESVITAYSHLKGVVKFSTACYVFYTYDHLLTFADEVSVIWSRSFTFASLLFCINRYLTYFDFIINQAAFLSNWPDTAFSVAGIEKSGNSIIICIRCKHFVRFEGVMTVVLVANVEIILILRLYCLYGKSRILLVAMLILLVAQISLSAWAVSTGLPVDFHGLFQGGCILTSDKSFAALIWATSAGTDTVIFGLTLYKALRHYSIRRSSLGTGNSGSLIDLMLRDGIWYFCAIFSANLLNLLISSLAVNDLKVSAATFSQVIASVLISRMQLNLKTSIAPTTSGGTETRTAVAYADGPGEDKWRKPSQAKPNSLATFMTVDNLGEDIHDWTSSASTEEQAEDEIELTALRSAAP